MEGHTRPGDQFKQNRSMKRSSTSSSNQSNSFLSIQHEQQRESARNLYDTSNTNSHNNNGWRGGGRAAAAAAGGSNHPNRPSSSRPYNHQRRPYPRSNTPNLSDLPLEQGRIHTLLDNFGFIYCADRPVELFFHYSELSGIRSPDIQLHDEVEFYVGPSSSRSGGSGGGGGGTDGGGGGGGAVEKLSAYQVRLLEPGTVQWEVEDQPLGVRTRGKVERVSRVYTTRDRDRERGGGGGGTGSGSNEGTIRVLLDNNDNNNNDDEKKKPGTLVRYHATHSNNDGSHSRLLNGRGFARNDIVEFTIVTEKRSRLKHARNITMIQSEAARLEEERERKMLESASKERGVVVTLKDNFGFLRSDRRKEEVYFHYSHVVLPEGGGGRGGGGGGNDDGANDDNEDNEYTLAEGQDMEFLVVTEPDDGNATNSGSGGGERRKKYSARKVQFLEKGTVVFHQLVAQGVTGILSKTPTPSVQLSSSRNRRSTNGQTGLVRLDSPVQFRPVEDDSKEVQQVTEVVLLPEDTPGGSFPINRDGSKAGTWLREGDTLLFDVVRDVVDGKCRAAPTKYIRPKESSPSLTASEGIEGDDTRNENKDGGSDDSIIQHGLEKVRIVSVTLGGRAEGIVSSIKDNYGFIQLAGRNADAYFRLNDVLPLELQESMIKNADPNEQDVSWNPADRNLEVGTEVSFDLSLQLNNLGGRGHSGRQQNDKEQVRAQRLAILPPSSVKLARTVAVDRRATVVKESPRQKGAGQLELENKVTGVTMKERYPIIARLLELVKSKGKGYSVSFHDAQSEKEHNVIKDMVSQEDELELCNTLVTTGEGSERNFVRIVIANVGRTTDQPKPSVTEEQEQAGSPFEGEDKDTNANETPAVIPPVKKAKPKAKSTKTVYFDSQSLSSDFEGPQLGKGDVVACDIIQCCRTGTFSVKNIKLMERNSKPEDPTKNETKSGMGIVLEAIESRQCGRISAYLGNSTKRQTLSFSYSDVSHSPSLSGESPTEGCRAIRKGDEVTFDIVNQTDRKLSAKNIVIVPQGTINISNRGDKNQCQGYILMAPSHTSLAHTPSSTFSKGSESADGTEGGRWSSCVHVGRNKQSDETNLSGRILLLSDSRQSVDASKGDTSTSISNPDDTFVEQSQTHESKGTHKLNDSSVNTEHSVKNNSSVSLEGKPPMQCHLSYGSTSIRGHGMNLKGSTLDTPKRGDLVSFTRGKGGKVRDICVLKSNAATMISGTLVSVDFNTKTARFCPSSGKDDQYEIALTEVVSCEASLLKDHEMVEGILHSGQIFGVCRTADLYLKSKIPSGLKERPRLNLTVKKELKGLGGKIIAQSGMAKGPDGTIGFVNGWTKRTCALSQVAEGSKLNYNSKEFVPGTGTVTSKKIEESELPTDQKL